MMCDQCQAIAINGINCHEQGCPNYWMDPLTGEPYQKECKECGCKFTPDDQDQELCDDQCAAHYWGSDFIDDWLLDIGGES